jgi:glyoxylase-like metal-dependent hydrolase (beta-lactamase superfamily II)
MNRVTVQIHTIDLRFQNTPGIVAAFLIESGNELALVEAGPGSTLPGLLDGIRAFGFDPASVKHVFVTHIHLDHAGAAGWWAQQGATVYVHPRGAKHLVDPEKLIASATQIYGDKMHALWGDLLPAPEDKVVALKDGETVKIGKAKIVAVETPGHAKHHHAYVIDGCCFTGDVAGARLQGCDYISVTAAPPQFDPAAYLDSITRLHDAGFEKLYLTHFGEITDVSAHLTRYAQRVTEVDERIAALLECGSPAAERHLIYQKSEHGVAVKCGTCEPDWRRYELVNGTAMCADGIALYHEKEA